MPKDILTVTSPLVLDLLTVVNSIKRLYKTLVDFVVQHVHIFIFEIDRVERLLQNLSSCRQASVCDRPVFRAMHAPKCL